jgi:hypothetical protein
MTRGDLAQGFFMVRSAGYWLAAAVGLFALAAPALAADPIGKVVAVGGSPTGSGRALSAGSPVYVNDKLVTGKGNIQIIFIDDTKLVVGPNSTLVVDRFLLRGGKSAQKFSVNALRGTFRFISGDMAKKAYDIQTASATIGIRGTAFDFSSGNETLIAVLQGNVSLCASGECATIPDKCSVGRARKNDVGQLGGRSKGQALRQLPFIVNQGPLARSFRLNTQSCRSSLSLLPTMPNNNKGPANAGPQGAGPEGPPGGPPGGGPPGGGPPGGTPGGGPAGGGGGGGGSGGGPGRGGDV